MAYRIVFSNRLSGELDSKSAKTQEEIAEAIIDLVHENHGVFEPGDSISIVDAE